MHGELCRIGDLRPQVTTGESRCGRLVPVGAASRETLILSDSLLAAMNTTLIPERRCDADWLRAFGMIVIFLFHCAVFFSFEDWHVKNNRLDFGMTAFVGIVSQWIMPLFFVLSGVSTCYALDHRTPGQFVGERFRRLIVPLLFGILVLAPPQVYIERVTHGQFVGSFVQFFPHYFVGFYRLGGNFAWMGLHLWYLEMLFVFSLILLPLFRLLKRTTMLHHISATAVFFKKPGTIFLLAGPVGFMELFANLQPGGIGRTDFGGWSPLVYLIFFILGYLVASDNGYKLIMEKHRTVALVMSVMTTGAGYALLTSGFSPRGCSFAALRAFNSWFCLVTILGFGSRYLTFSTGFLTYANEAVLPFYILHQTIIVIIGYLLAGWDVGVMLKYLVLSTVSLAAIVILYDKAIKRKGVLRFLFGMKPK